MSKALVDVNFVWVFFPQIHNFEYADTCFPLKLLQFPENKDTWEFSGTIWKADSLYFIYLQRQTLRAIYASLLFKLLPQSCKCGHKNTKSMGTVMIFAQKSNKKTVSPVRGLNSSQGTPSEKAKRLHKKQGRKLLNGLQSHVNKKHDTELLLEIGALLTNKGTSHRMRIQDKAT